MSQSDTRPTRTRQASARAAAARELTDNVFEAAVVHYQESRHALYEAAGEVFRRKDGIAYAYYHERTTVDSQRVHEYVEFAVEIPGDRASELRAEKAALLASAPGRLAARRAAALSALRERARNGRVPDHEEKMRRLREAAKQHVEQREAGIKPTIARRLEKLSWDGFSRKVHDAVPRRVFDEIRRDADEIAEVLANPGPGGESLYMGHNDYKDELDESRAEFTSLTHRGWTGGMLGKLRKTGMAGDDPLYKRMVRKAFEGRLRVEILDALVDLRLFQTDHLNAELTDDPLNFVLMFASANAMFGRATCRALKERFVGPVAWAGARAFVVEATSRGL
mmetsp:Transcript_7254/g.22868  ORF Transcript_7254/g.22868 Transcript_7254/m.22868 type:complete len:337 (+) Transcript_7254:62-1072(+)